jgi:hypothetical protein
MNEQVTLPYTDTWLTGDFTEYANNIFTWCAEQGIEINLVENTGAGSLWDIDTIDNKILFISRWCK